MIYLDNSATTKVYDEVIEKMTNVMKKDFGNPSSLHTLGLDSEKLLKESREMISSCFSSPKESIVFTSGGTESDNLAIIGAYSSKKRESNHIVTTTIEHPAVLETIRSLEKDAGAKVTYIDVDKDSRLDLDGLKEAIFQGAALVSIMAVNNETGALMPLCYAKEYIEEAGNAGRVKPILHTDAVQAFGKEDVRSMPGDLITVSGHKINGPKGIGALCIKNKVNIHPVIKGGGQEKGLRSGTENLPGIVGFAKAAEITERNLADNRIKYQSLNKAMRDGILSEIKDVVINSPEEGAPSILNVSFLGTRGEVLLHTLEQDGIMVSTGAACSSGKNAHKSGSHVLKAMGLSEEIITGALRFSFGCENTIEEIEFTVDKLKDAVNRFRMLGRR